MRDGRSKRVRVARETSPQQGDSTPVPGRQEGVAMSASLTQLPEEVILAIGHSILLNSRRIAYLIATARTCKKLHRILVPLAYRAALERDSTQVLTRQPLSRLSLTSVMPAQPVVLWAAEWNRIDTLALLWQAQCSLHASASAASAKRHSLPPAAITTNLLASAFFYSPPHECQHDLVHTRWRSRPWYEDVEEATLRSGWCTALHIAAQAGSLEAIRDLVILYDARVDATARHICICRSLHMELVLRPEGIFNFGLIQAFDHRLSN